jgi:hypothetical protein
MNECGAKVDVVYKSQSDTLACTLDREHEGKHSAWSVFVTAQVSWRHNRKKVDWQPAPEPEPKKPEPAAVNLPLPKKEIPVVPEICANCGETFDVEHVVIQPVGSEARGICADCTTLPRLNLTLSREKLFDGRCDECSESSRGVMIYFLKIEPQPTAMRPTINADGFCCDEDDVEGQEMEPTVTDTRILLVCERCLCSPLWNPFYEVDELATIEYDQARDAERKKKLNEKIESGPFDKAMPRVIYERDTFSTGLEFGNRLSNFRPDIGRTPARPQDQDDDDETPSRMESAGVGIPQTGNDLPDETALLAELKSPKWRGRRTAPLIAEQFGVNLEQAGRVLGKFQKLHRGKIR